MKKILVLLALIAVAVSLCACEPNNEQLNDHLNKIEQLQEETLHRVEVLEADPEFE